MKVAENSPQNARNCTIFKNFLGGACPQTPLAKARSFAARDMPLRGMYIQNPRNFKVGPPPLKNPAYAPVDFTNMAICVVHTSCTITIYVDCSTLCIWRAFYFTSNINASFNICIWTVNIQRGSSR